MTRTITPEERGELKALTRNGKTSAKKFIYARGLLPCAASEDGLAWKVADAVEALGITSRAIEHLKKRFVEQGLEEALVRKPRTRPPRDIIFDGKLEAQLGALACSEAPEGYRRWTVRLLAEKVVELEYTKSVSHMTVQQILKKRNSSPLTPL